MENELVVYDHIKLSPVSQDMNGLGFMEGFSHLGSMIVVGEKANPDFLDRLYQAIDTNTQDYKVGLSLLLIPGITIRVLANTTQSIERIFSELHNIISQDWFNKTPSFLRKY
jgi:urease accessory protein